MIVTWDEIQAEKRKHPKHIPVGILNTYGMSEDIYDMTDEQFRDAIIKRKLKSKKITEEEAFVELI